MNMPDGGQRKKTSKLRLLRSGSSRLPTFYPFEFRTSLGTSVFASNLLLNLTLLQILTLLPIFGVSIEHCNGCG